LIKRLGGAPPPRSGDERRVPGERRSEALAPSALSLSIPEDSSPREIRRALSRSAISPSTAEVDTPGNLQMQLEQQEQAGI
jgi:hypothetical protein